MVRLDLSPPRFYSLIAAVCVFGGIFSTGVAILLSNPYALVFGPSLLVAAVAAISIRPRSETISLQELYSSSKLSIIYAVFLILLAGLYYEAGYRTDAVTVVTVVLVVLSVFIFLRVNSRIGLVLILTTALVLRATIFFSSPILFGVDPLSHARYATLIQEVGSIQPLIDSGLKYQTTPLYHIFVVTVVDVLGVSVHTASFMVATIPYTIIPAAVVYSITKGLKGVSAGSYAVILYLYADHSIRWSIESQPTSFGLVLFTIVIFLFFQVHETRRKSMAMLIALVGGAAAVMHQVSVTIIIVGLFALTFSHVVYSRARQPTRAIGGALAIVILLTGAIWTLFSYQHTGKPFLPSIVLNIISQLKSIGVSERIATSLPPGLPASTTGTQTLSLVHFLGAAPLLLSGFYGGLSHSRPDTPRGAEFFAIVSAVIIMFGVTFAAPLVNFTTIQPTRWIQFIYLLCAILGGVGLTSLVGYIPRKFRVHTVISFIMVYFVLMSGNAVASPDGPLLGDAPGAASDRVIDREYTQLKFVHEFASRDNIIIGDHRARVIMENHFGTDALTLQWHSQQGWKTWDQTLLIEQPILNSRHASYYYYGEHGATRVVGELPEEIHCQSNVVYTTDAQVGYSIRYVETGC